MRSLKNAPRVLYCPPHARAAHMGEWRNGSAPALHAGGCRFESDLVHQIITMRTLTLEEGIKELSHLGSFDYVVLGVNRFEENAPPASSGVPSFGANRTRCAYNGEDVAEGPLHDKI